MLKIREKVALKLKSYAKALDIAYNDASGALKTVPSGHKLSNGGQSLGTSVPFDYGQVLAIFNNSNVVAFVKTGPTTAVAAPTGPTNGIPVPAYSWLYISLGDDCFVISNSASVFAYTIDDDTYVQ
jgi:hypothetical protein